MIPGLLLAGKGAAAALAGWTVLLVETDPSQQGSGQLPLYLALISLGVAFVSAAPTIIGLFRRPPKPTKEELELARLRAQTAEAEAEAERLRHEK